MSVVPLFPDSLSGSVIVTVWVGVTIAVIFTLRFGWNLSGLVVPGYMTPLLLIKPLSAAVVFTEGVVTYLLVHTLSERCSRLGWWGSLFGRDRFFALVLVSVAVRLLGDGWLLPWIGQWWNEHFQQNFDYRGNLHSFGLIVVSLIANQFWKTGVGAGLPPLLVNVGLTYLAVRHGVMEFTNFNIGGLGYVYNDLAASLLATPKAYIVLLTTAWIASRMNLHYGWEFNGILIPSLLALQWYDPIKILSSFTEAFVILGLGRALLAIPAIARLHLEGPRALLFFFNIAFIYKMTLGWLAPLLWPTVSVADVYGFGYLLTTLIALRIHDKGIAARLTRATLQTSLVAVGVASLAGFALTLLLSGPQAWLRPARSGDVAIHDAGRPLAAMLTDDQVELNRPRGAGGAPVPLPGELEAFRGGLEQLRAYLDTGDDDALAKAARQLDGAHYQIYRVEQRYLYLRERQPANGWGVYVLDPQAAKRLLVEVPAPLEERGAFAAGAGLFNALQGRALAITGARRAVNPDRSLDVLTSQRTLFQAFHEIMARRDVLQVRGYTAQNVTTLAGLPASAYREGEAQPRTTLWVRRSLPPGLDLAKLKQIVGDLELRWQSTPLPNLQRDATPGGFAELALDRAGMRQATARIMVAGLAETPLEIRDPRIDGPLQEWLLAERRWIAERGTDRYRPPRLEELLYIDEEILTPLLKLIRTEYRDGGWTTEGQAALSALASAAGAVGYRLSRYRHRLSGQEYLLLAEDETGDRRYWGTYVFRLGKGPGYLVEVAHPLFEVNTFEYGVWLFERLEADILLLAGAHPEANRDGGADPLNPANRLSLFSLVNQVAMREAATRPLLAIGIRAYGIRPDEPAPPTDASLTCHNGASRRETLGELGQRLMATLEADGLTPQLLDGGPYAAGLQSTGVPQARYVNASIHKEFCQLWLSPMVRASYRQQSEDLLQQAQFDALEIETLRASLERDIAGRPLSAEPLPPGWQSILHAYLERRDIVDLWRLRAWPGRRYLRLLDPDTQMTFLLVLDRRNHLQGVANLAPRQPRREMVADLPPTAEQIARFTASQVGWLRFKRR
ncbi:MAG: poly-gamma-glutamate biosynthesis protein PgsC/CapC [Candidatus Competibacteraceae bacterium]|nr:poly-gamma-glutamate biosynthesis protein PgsC/CapC [Candidatus Competibacteraceae bacterium]